MSAKMGKNLHHQESHISLKNHSPGCMWGILHHFHHNRWHNVKKRLPRKPHGSTKHSNDQESTRSTSSETAEVQENIDSMVEISTVETKSVEPRPSPKSSMKSRIKALISEEMSRRRGRHRRSSSYPIRTQLDRSNSIHHLEYSRDLESPTENNSNDDLYNSVSSRTGSHGGNNTRSCELCSTMLNVKYLKQNEINNKLGRQHVRDHTLVEDKSVYAIEPSKHDSLQESKLFMDALDLLNMRKEVFMKILQDPSSSLLAHQLHCRRMSNLKFGLTKSVSFPVSGSSARNAFKSDNSIIEKENGIKEEDEVENCKQLMVKDSNKHLAMLRGSLTENGNQLEFSDNNASPRKRHDNKVVLKRFKNLREKLRHVIRDRKKEKNRIIMDAVHHKIPYGRGVSKNLHEDGHVMSPESKEVKFGKYSSDYGKSQLQSFKRTSSFNESLDRYNRLLEISLNKEPKDHVSDRLRSPIPRRPATLGRILSLPDLRSYSSLQIDDSVNSGYFHTHDAVDAENVTLGSEQKLLGLGSDNKVETTRVVSESGSQENLLDVGESFDDSADSKTWESASSHDLNVESLPISAPQRSKLDHVFENDDSDYKEDGIGQGLAISDQSEDSKFAHRLLPVEEDSSDIQQDLPYYDPCTMSENIVGIDNTQESQLHQFYNDIFHVHVDAKNKADFNYVKDILELSGFTRDEILGKWHSVDHPVDPLVFEEVEGCLVSQKVCSDNEEGGSFDHLLLFDLINEVLLDIYERSYCYWPMALTNRSRIHQMPKGYRVLEEVWGEIRGLLRWTAEIDQAIDDGVSRDLAKDDSWMNLQLDAECVGLEVEDLIFDDLIEEIIWT